MNAAELLRAALDALPDPSWCEGIWEPASPLALAVGQSTRALDDEDLAAWLVAHSEPAPFGDANGTRHDTAVRDALRLVPRGEVRVVGFDPAEILEDIERALASDCRIDAELLDVLVYPAGGKFVPHKDTPRDDDQLGTLVLELPHAHTGGALRVEDRGERVAFAWENSIPGFVRWVALFGDVDHEITTVTSGTRLTAVYTLRYRTGERRAAVARAQIDAITDAAIACYAESLTGETLAIPCGRMIVATRDGALPVTVAALRGADRLIAAALERAGLTLMVRALIVVSPDDDQALGAAVEEARQYRRLVVLRRAIPDAVIRHAHAISWHAEPESDEVDHIAAVAPYVDPEASLPSCTWIVREHARVLGEQMLFSHTGYFGNEYGSYHVYRFAVMLAEIPDSSQR